MRGIIYQERYYGLGGFTDSMGARPNRGFRWKSASFRYVQTQGRDKYGLLFLIPSNRAGRLPGKFYQNSPTRTPKLSLGIIMGETSDDMNDADPSR